MAPPSLPLTAPLTAPTYAEHPLKAAGCGESPGGCASGTMAGRPGGGAASSWRLGLSPLHGQGIGATGHTWAAPRTVHACTYVLHVWVSVEGGEHPPPFPSLPTYL